MKSERRHELEKNILADRLGGGIQAARPVLPFVLGGIGILVVGLLAWGIYSASARSRAATAWTEYYFNLTGNDAAAFIDVAEEFPRSTAALWARNTAGNTYLEQGIEALYRNRAEGEKLLNQAIDEFKVASTAVEPELRAKAIYGLAQSHEALGELDEAAEQYQKVVDSDAFPAIIGNAKRRLDFVSSPEGKSFYTWFGQLDPKPDSPLQLPSDMSLPPSSPGDMRFDPIGEGLGGSFSIPQSSDDNPAAPAQAVEIDPTNLPPLPGDVPASAAPESPPSETPPPALPDPSPASPAPEDESPVTSAGETESPATDAVPNGQLDLPNVEPAVPSTDPAALDETSAGDSNR